MSPTRLRVRVQPSARRDEVVGWQGDVLRVRVHAPPVEGRANQALLELLSRRLGVPKSLIAVEAGHAAREKLLTVEGLSDDELMRRLPARGS